MKIIKYSDFINESITTIESYSNSLLGVIKKRIDAMFQYQNDAEEGSEEEKMTVKKAKLSSKKDQNKPTFKEFNLRLDSSEVSMKNNNLTVKFSDDENSYSLFIKIETSEVANDIAAFPKEDGKDFSIDDIKKCKISFKKNDINTFEIIGQLEEKTVDPKGLDEEYLINLKIELDDRYGDKDEFEIEK